MKNILSIVFISLLMFFILFSPARSYELNDKDYEIINTINKKVIDIIDENKKISAEKVIVIFQNFLTNRETSERFQAIIETVIDDIKYEYYIWEYAQSFISEEDCYDDEYFDYTSQTCFLKTSSHQENEKNFINLSSPVHKNEDFSEETENLLASYNILEDEILLLDWKHTKENNEIWNIFIWIIPQVYRWDFKNFFVYDNKISDTSAYVAQNINDNNKWDLSINISSFQEENGLINRDNAIETLIHEFAHVLTLWKTQVRYIPIYAWDQFIEKAEQDCKTYFIWEWCLSSDSYLYWFIKEFWQENFSRSQDNIEDDFFSENKNAYITEYAASNPWEDIAESFSFFVLLPKPDGENIAEDKLLFFYQYPELIKLRNFIRMRIVK